MAVEEAKFSVIDRFGSIEVREYAEHMLAEVRVRAEIEEAGNMAFSKLFRYISGNNESNQKIAMTAPVSQQKSEDSSANNAEDQPEWMVSFMMPANMSLEDLPEPDDKSILLRKVPSRLMASIRYSGFWSEKNYAKHKSKLLEQLKGSEIYDSVGEPIWARYNAPFTPWFLRRNEVLIEVSKK